MKWHNGPMFTSGPIFKAGWGQIAPGAEYERHPYVLTSVMWDSMRFAELTALFETDPVFIKSALERRGFVVDDPNDEVPGEHVRAICSLFSSRAKQRPKRRSIFVMKVTDADTQTRTIRLISSNDENSEELELPLDFPITFADGTRQIPDVTELTGRRLAFHYNVRKKMDVEGNKFEEIEIYRITCEVPIISSHFRERN